MREVSDGLIVLFGEDREIKEGDIAVINYHGTCDGKPITELAPAATMDGNVSPCAPSCWVQLRQIAVTPKRLPRLNG